MNSISSKDLEFVVFLSHQVLFFFPNPLRIFITRVFSFLYSTQRLQQAKDASLGSREISVLLVRSHNFFSSFSNSSVTSSASSTEKRFELSSFFMSGRTWVRKWKEITKNHGRQTLRLSTRGLAEQQNESLLLTLVLVIAVFE